MSSRRHLKKYTSAIGILATVISISALAGVSATQQVNDQAKAEVTKGAQAVKAKVTGKKTARKVVNYSQFSGSVSAGTGSGWVRVNATWANAPATVRITTNCRKNSVPLGGSTDLTRFKPGEKVTVTFISTATGGTIGTASGTAHK